MEALIADVEAKMTDARLGGGQKAAERMQSKGKKLPRERCVSRSFSLQEAHKHCHRLSLLLDPHTPFLELSPLAAHDVYPAQSIPGAGLITGVGRISGRECMIVVNDATVKGGSYYPLTVR